jgi:hypothetical protein
MAESNTWDRQQTQGRSGSGSYSPRHAGQGSAQRTGHTGTHRKRGA